MRPENNKSNKSNKNYKASDNGNGKYATYVINNHYRKNECHFSKSTYIMPSEEDRMLGYKGYHTAYEKNCIIKADFEALNDKGANLEECRENDEKIDIKKL